MKDLLISECVSWLISRWGAEALIEEIGRQQGALWCAMASSEFSRLALLYSGDPALKKAAERLAQKQSP